MEGIQVNVTPVGASKDISEVHILGYIDTTTSSELERILQNLLREQKFKIIINLKDVDYISSAGWGIFISEIKNIRMQKGDLKLACMSESVNEVYELLEFSTILTSAETVADAVTMFEDSGAKAVKPAPAPAAAKPAAPPKPVPAPKPAPAAVPSKPAPAPVPEPVKTAPKERPTEAGPVNGTVKLVSLIDRIKEIIRSHPDWGAWKIKNELNRTRGTQPKVSWGEVRTELKYSNLNKKDARYRLARGL